MLAELHGKGGRLCGPAREGRLRCPLLVRPTSEDVITGHVVHALRLINPRHWAPDLLGTALGMPVRRPVYRGLLIDPWVTLPRYPAHLLPWAEGSTQVDIQITWQNPPTTVFVECKYGSDLSPSVAADDGRSGFPTDQLVRNVRMGLWATGHLNDRRLFPSPPRRFFAILFTPAAGHPLVARYRDPATLRASVPHAGRFTWPAHPVVGQLDYAQLKAILSVRLRLMTRAERQAAEALIEYLSFKSASRPRCRLPVTD